MRLNAVSAATWLACAVLATAPARAAGSLTFEQRVEAQRAIERVYFSHLTGTRRTFEEAVTQELLEKKVRAYLKQSVALEQVWHTPVTAASLRAEAERILRGSQFPGRLREIDAALGHDPFLFQETLVRSTLAKRLTHNFYTYDQRIHEAARAEAETLRAQLLDGDLDVTAEHPRRTVREARRTLQSIGTLPSATTLSTDATVSSGLAPLEAPGQDYDELLRSAPEEVGEIGPVREEAGEFTISVLLDSAPGQVRVAKYTVNKTTWDSWWSDRKAGFDETLAAPVADGSWDGLDYLASATAQICGQDDTWQNGSLDDMPDPRERHEAVWTGSEMIIWGGASNGGRYDPMTDTWRPVSLAGAPAIGSSIPAVWTDHAMIIWGYTDGAHPSGASYNPIADTWTPISASNEPALRVGHAAVWTGTEMLVWGGRAFGGGYPSVGGRYNPATDTWRPISTTDAPSNRTGQTAVWTGHEMIVWGGVSTGAFDTFHGTGARYDPVNDRWTPMSTFNSPSPRTEHTAVWSGSEMIVWGGRSESQFGQSPTATGGRYDPASDAWTPTSLSAAPTGRRAHTAVWTGARMIVWGGAHNNGNPGFPLHTGGKYDPSTNTWQATSTSTAPLPALLHSAVWTGDLMVVWGGSSPGFWVSPAARGARYEPSTDSWTPTAATAGGAPAAALSTLVWTGSEALAWSFGGGRYDPTTDHWRGLSTTNSPPASFRHAAIWTGDEMVVWGGTDDFTSVFGTGGRYDPLSDTWRSISMIDAPEPRMYVQGVWTGSEVIIWGGYRYPTTLLGGGRYDPLTDQWRPLSLANAPPGVINHSLVWTGVEMIVWGGWLSTTGPIDVGARYNPERDEWHRLPSLPPGQARDYHSAAWTGREMISFGNDRVSTYPPLPFEPGWIYDRAADSWSPLPTPGFAFPQPSLGHSAVWTGRHMLLWGVLDYPAPFLSPGASFDHVTREWRTFNSENAPRRRAFPEAVWTGTSMLVWGGEIQGGMLNSGGRYIFGQDSDDDGDGLSECAGDCDDTDAMIFPGSVERCNGRDDTCDGSVDEDSLGVDTDSDGTPNACDSCPELPNPDQSGPFDCIVTQEDGGTCLEAQTVLAEPIAEGSVTLIRDQVVPPDAISFEFNLSTCERVDPVELLLNGELIGTFVAPQLFCDCVPPLYRETISDAALIRSLWRTTGDNSLGFRKAAAQVQPDFEGTFMSWVRAWIGSGREQRREMICIWDVGSNYGRACTEDDQCPGFWTEHALDISVETPDQLLAEEALSTTSFTDSTLPGAIDISSIPDGPLELCIGPDAPAQLLAGDGSGGLYQVETTAATSVPYEDLASGLIDVAHDPIKRRTYAQTTLAPGDDLVEFDLVSGTALSVSPFVGRRMAGLEFVNSLLYGIEAVETGVRVVELDPVTGYQRVVGTLPDGIWDGLAYDTSSWLLLASRTVAGVSTLWSIEPQFGVATNVGLLSFQPTALEFGPDGLLYATRDTGSDTELYRVDPATGASTLAGPMGITGVVSLATVRNWPRACVEITKQGETTLSLTGSCNAPPTALAGVAPAAECTSPAGAMVRLDGSGSSDADSSPGTNDGIVSFEWLEDFGAPAERALGTGEILDVQLPLGAHTITLRVTDSAGETALDHRTVSVVDTTGPLVVAGFQQISAPPGGGRGGRFTVSIAVTDACAAAPNVSAALIGQGCEPEPAHNGQLVEFIPAVSGCSVTTLGGARAFEARSLLLRVIALDGSENRTTVQTRLEGFGPDSDQDGVDDLTDCAPGDARLWLPPGEADGLEFESDGLTITWTGPAEPGANVVRYDLLEAAAPGDFAAGAVCVEADDSDTSGSTPQLPSPGQAHYFLVRAENGCPGLAGAGSPGASSTGVPRPARSCS